jgi:hypothetical protein
MGRRRIRFGLGTVYIVVPLPRLGHIFGREAKKNEEICWKTNVYQIIECGELN